MATLRTKNLTKSYSGRTVVREVSLDVNSGEVVGLLGPNGAGKTTTFYMVVGLTAPDKGHVILDGKDVTDDPMYIRARKGIGYLPQEPSIFRGLTVEQNILAILETLDLDRAARRARADELLNELKLAPLAKSPAHTLSGGERRRVEITRALVISPAFILLDEPFAGIDPIAVTDIQAIIFQLKERGIGVLITDHNVRETRRITDRTGGIIVTHLFGNPCDMDEIMAIARKHNLPVIEDCAQAHLARYKGKLVGTIGDIGCFSLGGKTLTTGGGGMIITDNKELAARAMGHARKGAEVDIETRSSMAPTSYRRGSPGGYAFLGDYHKMSDLQAAVGLAQFERYDQYTETRRRAAAILDEELYELPGLTIQQVRPGNEHTYYVYGYKIDESEMGVSPIEFWKAVRAEGIEIVEGPYLRGTPLYKYPLFADAQTYGTSGYPFVDEQGNKRIDYNEVHLPVVERELPKTGFILFRSTFSDQDARDIAAAVRKVALHYAARRK